MDRSLIGEIVAQAIQPALPGRAPGTDPLLDRLQRGRLEPAGPHAGDLLPADEPAGLEHLEVLDHRRQRHRQRARELADRGRSVAQPLDDDPPARIGQRLEDAIGLILKHPPKYTFAPDSYPG